MRAIDRDNLLNEAVTTVTSYVSFNVTRTTKVLEFITMKEIKQNLIEQREKDDTTLNYVSKEAQVAILNPDLSDSIKDEILTSAVGTINQIAERRWIYEAIPGKNAGLKQSDTIYESK